MHFATALITGASGFIGGALLRRLRESGVAVTCLGRHASRLPDGVPAIRVPRFDPPTLRSCLADQGYEVIFHLAAYGVSPSDRERAAMFETNVAGTAALVEVAADVGCRAFVHVGSCSEYATPTREEPVGEDHPLNHEALYGASKAAAGLWGHALARAVDVPFQWLRLFNVYGPGEAAHRLVPHLADHLRRSEPVPLTAGAQFRDFLHVEDVVTGLLLAADAALLGRLGPFNLCSGQAVTVKSLAQHVAAASGKPEHLLRFNALSYRPGEPLWLVGRPDRFAEATGFRAKIALEDGLARMLRDIEIGRTDHG